MIIRKKNQNPHLNRTTYETNQKQISSTRHIHHLKKKNRNKHPSEQTKSEEDDALPIIRDEDFEKIDPHESKIEHNKVINTEQSEEVKMGDEPPKSITQRHKNTKANEIYNIRQSKYNQPRLHSHQNRAKMRIQGRYGKTEEYVNIEKSLDDNNKQKERRKYIIKARERHKIQEKIEKYREEKIQREIELLEEAKRLEQEERQAARAKNSKFKSTSQGLKSDIDKVKEERR